MTWRCACGHLNDNNDPCCMDCEEDRPEGIITAPGTITFPPGDGTVLGMSEYIEAPPGMFFRVTAGDDVIEDVYHKFVSRRPGVRVELRRPGRWFGSTCVTSREERVWSAADVEDTTRRLMLEIVSKHNVAEQRRATYDSVSGDYPPKKMPK